LIKKIKLYTLPFVKVNDHNKITIVKINPNKKYTLENVPIKTKGDFFEYTFKSNYTLKIIMWGVFHVEILA
jgi:hypothetical protein